MFISVWKARLREVGLFSRDFIISKASRATFLALMAPRPAFKSWDERIRSALCLLIEEQSPKMPKAILRVAESIKPKNATNMKTNMCTCVYK